MANPTSEDSPELGAGASLRRTFKPKSKFGPRGLLKSLFPTIPTLVSVAFGFALKAFWNESQASKLRHIEAQRAIRSLSLELQQNVDATSNDLQIVDRDIVAADQKQEVVEPMSAYALVVGNL